MGFHLAYSLVVPRSHMKILYNVLKAYNSPLVVLRNLSDQFLYIIIQVAVVGFVSGDKLDAFNAAGDSFDDVPFGVLDADAAAALEVAEGQVALLKQVSTVGLLTEQSQTAPNIISKCILTSQSL